MTSYNPDQWQEAIAGLASAGLTANNASVGADGSAIPASSTLLGASDGTNLQPLLVESATNRNLRIGIYNGANEVAVDASGRLTLVPNSSANIAQVGGSALAFGSAVSASSLPVVIASDQAPLGSGTATRTNVTAATSDTSLLASNTSRKGAMFFNDSTAILYLAYGTAAASTTSYTVQVPANSLFEMPPAPVYTGAIRGIWSAANGSIRVTELS